MGIVTVDAKGKFNPILHVLGKNLGGYHSIQSVIFRLSLSDKISLRESSTGKLELNVQLSDSLQRHMSCLKNSLNYRSLDGSDNLAYRAAKAFMEFADTPAISLQLLKRIPLQAGLGGGSADAAAVLRGLFTLFPNRLSKDKLYEIASHLGSDVPPLLSSCPVYCEGRGEKVTELGSSDGKTQLSSLSAILLKPSNSVDTSLAYQLLKRPHQMAPPEFPLEALQLAPVRSFFDDGHSFTTDSEGKSLTFTPSPSRSIDLSGQWESVVFRFENDFEKVVTQAYPEIAEARTLLEQAGAQKVLLCGSGSALIAFSNKPVESVLEVVRAQIPSGWFCTEVGVESYWPVAKR